MPGKRLLESARMLGPAEAAGAAKAPETAEAGKVRPAPPAEGLGRDFALVLSGQAVSMQGDGLMSVALLWWIAGETGSVGVATLLALLTTLPVIFLSPVAGVFVDRYSRRRLMMLTDVVRATCAVFLAWGMTSLRTEALMGLILAASTVSAACRAFHRPALQASIAQLVPEKGLNRANSLFQLAEGASNLIAPAVGGALVAWLGAGAVMVVYAATCAVAALTLLFAAIPPLPVPSGTGSPGRKRFLREMADGFAYLWTGQRMLFFMLCLFALANFALAPLGPLLPFIAQQRMGVDASGLGLLMSGLSAGTILGAALVSVIGSRLRRGVSVIWMLTLVGLALAAVSQLRALVPAVAGMTIAGAAVSVVNICSNGLFQTHVPKEMQGRVFAVRSSVAQAASPISLALVGVASAAIAPHTVVFIAGILVAAGGLMGYAVPGLAAAE